VNWQTCCIRHNMTPDELEERAYRFEIAVLKLCRSLPRSPEIDIVRYQLGKAATSTSANYRACRRGRSRAEFIAKLSVFRDSEIVDTPKVRALLAEAGELRSIFAKSYGTARRNSNSGDRRSPNRPVAKLELQDSQIAKSKSPNHEIAKPPDGSPSS
jgi:23S rRNA-intervening sequence protein